MYPFRFSLLTANLWNTELWDIRSPAVGKFLDMYRPDICCFQEVRDSTLRELDGFLPHHTRIDDTLPGWHREGNIYYRNPLFEEIGHGAVDLGMPETDRRMFWIRLRITGCDHSLFIATVHLTHQENADECATGCSYRHHEVIRMGQALQELVHDGEMAILCGDFNDPVHPVRQLGQQGFQDVFGLLGTVQESTFPCAAMTEEIHMNESIDKIVCKGELRPLLACVPHFYYQRAAISDHWPVIAVFSVEATW